WCSGHALPSSFPRWIMEVAATLALLVWPAVQSGPVLHRVWKAYQQFPMLADFAVPSALAQWSVEQGTIELAVVTGGESPSGAAVGRVTLRPGDAPYSTVTFHPICDNW